MARVRKRHGKWRARYVDASGRRVEIVLPARTKTEAAEIAAELERNAARVRLGLESAVIQMTFSDLWKKYAPVAESLRSWDHIRSRFTRHILPEFRDELVHRITPAAIETFLAKKAKPYGVTSKKGKKKIRPGLGPQSREHLRMHLSSIFVFAIEKLKIFKGENPALAANEVQIPEKPPRFLELPAVGLLLQHIPDQWRGFFAVGVFTGMRPAEIKGLRVSDVDLARRIIRVWYTSSGTTKTARFRVVPITEELLPYLKVELGRVRSEWLFPSARGGQISRHAKLARLTRNALKRAGIVQGFDLVCRTRGQGRGCGYVERRADDSQFPCPRCGRQLEAAPVPISVQFRDLRSTFGTHAAEQTGDLRVVQRILGHSDIRVTESRYAFARDRHLVEQAKKISLAPPRPRLEDENRRNPPKTAEVKNIR